MQFFLLIYLSLSYLNIAGSHITAAPVCCLSGIQWLSCGACMRNSSCHANGSHKCLNGRNKETMCQEPLILPEHVWGTRKSSGKITFSQQTFVKAEFSPVPRDPWDEMVQQGSRRSHTRTSWDILQTTLLFSRDQEAVFAIHYCIYHIMWKEGKKLGTIQMDLDLCGLKHVTAVCICLALCFAKYCFTDILLALKKIRIGNVRTKRLEWSLVFYRWELSFNQLRQKPAINSRFAFWHSLLPLLQFFSFSSNVIT